QVLLVFPMALPIGIGHAPRLERVALELLESLLLLLLADVQKELLDRCAIVGKHALELDDISIRLAPGFFRHQPFHAILEDAAVPAMVEDRHLAAFRNLEPESPYPWPLLFVSARCGDRIQLEPAGVHSLRQSRDGRALSGGIPSFEHENRGDAVIPAGLLQIV